MKNQEILDHFEIQVFQLPARASVTLPLRLISRLEPHNSHWLWTGTQDQNGYGVIGRGVRGSGNIPTHAAMWQLVYGPSPEGYIYDHICRIPLCCNPEHGEYVTRGENVMRGIGVAPTHAKRTHCNHGHLLDGMTITKKSGQVRYCKTCAREKTSKRRKANK